MVENPAVPLILARSLPTQRFTRYLRVVGGPSLNAVQ